jgi:nicotinamide-nucleotide amidase
VADKGLLPELVQNLAELCVAKNLTVVTAESCTGGMLSTALTSLDGSSAWFDRAYVTYENRAKQECLGVPEALIDLYGAVSEPVARVMASGAIAESNADISVSITGIAGPGGGSAEKPVGTVWFACQIDGELIAVCEVFSGDRDAIRKAATLYAIKLMLKRLKSIG